MDENLTPGEALTRLASLATLSRKRKRAGVRVPQHRKAMP